MGISRKPFEERLHPRGFGGKFGHGTGTKKAAASPGRGRNDMKNVTTGGRLKRKPPAATAPTSFFKVTPKVKAPEPITKASKAAPTAKKATKPAVKPKVATKTGVPRSAKVPPVRPPDDWDITRGTTSEGRAFAVANDVAALSTSADFASSASINSALSDTQRMDARDRARVIFLDSVARAPGIRNTIRDAVAEHDGIMGREYDDDTHEPTAVKTEHSTWRKVQKKMDEKGLDANQVRHSDSVRFTAVFGDDSYTEGVAAMRDALEALGYKLNEPPPDINDGKGGWALGAYRGLNMTFKDEHGFVFEVQAHTEKSLEIAQTNHGPYDVVRTSVDADLQKMMDDGTALKKTGVKPENFSSPAAYREHVNQMMFDAAESVPIPKGVIILAAKDQWGQVVRVANETGMHSSRTGEPLISKKKAVRR